jgi:predicted MFS family arabinose efflux permease
VLWWRATFAATGVVGTLLLVWTVWRFPETKRADSFSISAGARYLAVMRNAQYRRFAAPPALIMGAMSAFFGDSPPLFIERLGITPT